MRPRTRRRPPNQLCKKGTESQRHGSGGTHECHPWQSQHDRLSTICLDTVEASQIEHPLLQMRSLRHCRRIGFHLSALLDQSECPPMKPETRSRRPSLSRVRRAPRRGSGVSLAHLREFLTKLSHYACDIGVNRIEWADLFRFIEQAGDRQLVADFSSVGIPACVGSKGQHFSFHVFCNVLGKRDSLDHLRARFDQYASLPVNCLSCLWVVYPHGRDDGIQQPDGHL